MKAYTIDPWAKEMKEVQVRGNDLDELYSILSHAENAVEVVDAVMMPNGIDALYVDEESLVKLEIDEPFPGAVDLSIPAFAILGYPQPFFGKGLVIGTTPEGGDSDASILEGALRSMVAWPAPHVVAAWLRAN